MPKNKKIKLVRCAACECRVPKAECVPYGDNMVCKPCDSEMVDRDEELYEQDMQREIDRVWGYGL